jgi:23S rRNA (cytosine1962-C5)-methyltransferase
MGKQCKIILKKGREESLKRFHPWVFSGAIARMDGSPAEGDIVSVWSASGEFLASGHYQIGSISVRVLSFDSEVLMPDFWEERLNAAYHARMAFGLAGSLTTTCYRLVHGEGDNLPGLIIDIYGDTAVMQCHSVGMFKSRERITEALKKVYGKGLKAVYDKSAGTAPFKAGLDLKDGYLWKSDDYGSESCRQVLEYGHKFYVNWEEGQKTGFFLDQRENRFQVGKYAKDRNVLNLFCYTGGFTLYALAGGAKRVDSVDSSQAAMDMLARNVDLNGFGPQSSGTFCADAIDFLKNSEDGKYDLMIVDPPAFAKHRGALDNALRAYRRLNANAIAKVAPGGFVFTFSCSEVVDHNAFALAVFSAAASVGRKVRIMDRLNQPADHPVNIYHPEGEYLKGLALYVE